MGCCASTSNKALPSPATIRSSRARSPPPSFEEETVKEVLSETPIPMIENEAKTICSFNNNGEVRRRVDRSPARFIDCSFSGEFPDRVAGKSPVRRSEPSPGRVRMVPGRERWDTGDSSSRRSRSPASRTDGGQMSGSGRIMYTGRAGVSPGRVRSEVCKSKRSRIVEERDNKEVNKWPPTTNESLENPLVSLECFIFL